MILKTETGSRYELDPIKKQIRRLSGVNEPTARIGKDASWRPYKEVSDPEVGAQMLIVWTAATELLPETKAMLGDDAAAVPTTLTSRVVAIEST